MTTDWIRGRMADEAIAERNIPSELRPGCKRFVMRETFSNKAQALALVDEFAMTTIGTVTRNAGGFTFDGDL